MKQKTVDRITAALLTVSIIYIFGQCGALDCDTITTKQFIIRAGIGTLLFGLGALLSNYRVKEKAHQDPPVQSERTTKISNVNISQQ